MMHANNDQRVAVIGAGVAGLTAADTLRSLGFKQVVVYETQSRAGGKIESSAELGTAVELGAAFATDAYAITLEFARRYAVPIVARPLTPAPILDDDGALCTPPQFAIRKYGLPALQKAIQSYAAVLEKYAVNDKSGFVGMPSELRRPFSEFAEHVGIVPVADMFRVVAIAFGYPYYEDVPAVYILRCMDGLLRVGPKGAYTRTTYFFPNGFQEVFTKLADDLASRDATDRQGIIYNAQVTKIVRAHAGARPEISITANGKERVFDRIIVTTPPKATQTFLDLTAEERELFNQAVSRNYHVTVSVVSGVAPEKADLYFYPHTRIANIGHVNYWSKLWTEASGDLVMRTFQNVDWSQSTPDAQRLLAKDLATYAGGSLVSVLLHRQWDNFPHFETSALEDGAYERLDALQGKHGVFFAGGLMGFEAVETSARYARDLVLANFSG